MALGDLLTCTMTSSNVTSTDEVGLIKGTKISTKVNTVWICQNNNFNTKTKYPENCSLFRGLQILHLRYPLCSPAASAAENGTLEPHRATHNTGLTTTAQTNVLRDRRMPKKYEPICQLVLERCPFLQPCLYVLSQT